MAETAAKGKYGRFLSGIMTVCDIVVVNTLFGAMQLWHPDMIPPGSARVIWLLLSLSCLPAAYLQKNKRVHRTTHIDRIVVGALRAVLTHALLFVSLLTFVGIDLTSTWYYIEFYALLGVLMPASWAATRLAVKQYRDKGHNYTRVVIVGTNATAVRLGEAMMKDPGYGYRLLGYFDIKPLEGFTGHYMGNLDTLESFIRTNHVDELYYVLSGDKEEAMLRVVQITDNCLVQFHFVPKISRYIGRRFGLANFDGLPVLTPRVNPLSYSLNRWIKRGFDFLFSSVALICSPILFIPIAIAVKLSSPGPVFFKQKRTGYMGREFDCYKFRTMRVNAAADDVQATATDPRKTKVGDFLRRTSLDELPQFINVWLGDMSIVGPRPHMLAHTKEYSELIDRYMVRHMVKPGITGWAQVCGYRGSTDELWKMEGRVLRDVWYIEHWSFMLDIKIIIKTIVNAIVGEENAY